MQTFIDSRLANLTVPQDLIVTMGQIREFKGKQDLYRVQQPQILESLKQSAVYESVESSNRIEQVTASTVRIDQIVKRNARPETRSEAEIAGYKEVLNTIHSNALNIPRTTSVILQFHRDLYKHLEGRGGYWKRADNSIKEILPDGTERIRFQTVPAFETAAAMERLQSQFNGYWEAGQVDRLILIPAYVLDFLSIHPFPDGNGRMARLLALLYLYQDGFEVGRYISLERRIEETKDQYYDTLHACSQGWHEGTHSPIGFIDYFLSAVLLPCYRKFAERVESQTIRRGAKQVAVKTAVERAPDQFQVADIRRVCPNVSQATINLVLRQLRQEGAIMCIRAGRDAIWEKAG